MKPTIYSIFIMSVTSCIPVTEEYFYISLEDVPNIEIVETNKVKLNGLRNNSEIPKKYLIGRLGYELVFTINDDSYLPHLDIQLISQPTNDLHLVPRRNMDLVSERGTICSNYYANRDNSSVMGFGWSTGCLDEHFEKTISFDVVDSSSNLTIRENIPFKIGQNGKYTVFDGL